jgi:hypothetical protein
VGADIHQQPEDHPALPLGPFGDYVLEELRRRDGELVACYRARQAALGRGVELRLLLPQDKLLRVRFVEQTRLLARLHHPAILPVMDAGSCDGRPYFTTPLRRCTRLAELMEERGGTLGAREVLRYGEVLADALGLLHARGVLHRGISADSVYYDQDRDSVYFGECTSLFELEGAQMTRRGIPRLGDLVGTPERLRGEPRDTRSDVFQLCALLYHLLVGRPAFDLDAFTLEELRARGFPAIRHLAEIPGAVDDLADLGDLVMRGLDHDPDRRPQDAAELADELEAVAQRSAIRLVVREEEQRGRGRPLTLAMARPVSSTMIAWVPARRRARGQTRRGLLGLVLAAAGVTMTWLAPEGSADAAAEAPPATRAGSGARTTEARRQLAQLASNLEQAPTDVRNFDARWDGLRRWVRARGPGGACSYAEVMTLRSGSPATAPAGFRRLEDWIRAEHAAAQGEAP